MTDIQQTQQNQFVLPTITRLLKQRGLSAQQINEFFSWDLKALPLLTGLKDLHKAAQRLIVAMEQKEKIGIYGDYDVDGTTSCALLYHFFQYFEIEVELIQPSRFIEGYGIHPPSIEKAWEQGIKVLVTVDCGITNSQAATKANELGMDLIITDHHKDALPEMPAAFAVVNPNRRDEDPQSPLVSLAGVGVAFALCLEIKNILAKKEKVIPSLYPLLQFVAIGTICDLAKLNNMNLKLVRHGLKQIPNTQYPGILAFFTPEERKRGFVPSEKLSFGIGPLINSKGRLDHPEKALKLLIANDSSMAFENYVYLEVANKERKFIQANVVKEAKEQIIKNIQGPRHNISIAYQADWHEGVIGIVASKLVDNFKVPAVVFSDAAEAGIIKASARTAGKLDLFDCLNQCKDLFIKFGGHKAAAGLSMTKENLPEFKRRLGKIIGDIPENLRTNLETYDLEISAEEITPKLLKNLECLEPFGMGNAKPLFKMTGIKLDSYDLLKDIHVRWNFSSIKNSKIKLKGISFNYIGKWGMEDPATLYHNQNQHHFSTERQQLTAYFTLAINHFNGNQYIQLMVEKVTSQFY